MSVCQLLEFIPMLEPHDEPTAWHTLEPDEVSRRLRVNPRVGLSDEDAAARAATYGPNDIREQRRRGVARMLLDQFTDFMILVLIAAAVVSGLVGEPADTIAILVIVLLNGIIGFVQEYRAERAVAALRRLATPSARVRRGGEIRTVPATRLVPGDHLLLEAGNLVPADLYLLEARQLKADESALTGESVPIEKRTGPCTERDLPLGDRRNMAYRGTSVTYGRGTGLVVATGMETELGAIARLLGEERDGRTPLQKRLATFGQRLAVAALVICAIVFVAGVLRGESLILMFLTAVSLAVAAIPEALPAVVTISLALGARRMVQQHALIRRLPAVETLGSVTYICTDKTGTLTQNRMRVEQLYAGGQVRETREGSGAAPADEDPWRTLYRAMALNNDAAPDEHGEFVGDPTEVALVRAALESGYDRARLEERAPRIAELPFDSERQCMTTFHREAEEEGIVAFTKGAPERVLAQCDLKDSDGGAGSAEAILDRAQRMAAQGLRVLAFACRRWPELPAEVTSPTAERGLAFLGLAGLLDPPRPEAREAVAVCKAAGITPVMVTGDHPATALAIAVRLGISDEAGPVLTGQRLGRLGLPALESRAEQVRVYARVAPEQKINIVQALQDRGQYVAMTGDGVNDAPALKRADIGIAMGRGGTDVTREAADMVLLDDNFATIVAAVRAGRRIFDNIRKFIKYTMISNAGEIWTIFLAPFVGLPIPLLPIHILWVNLVTDGLPGLALAAEPEEPAVMQRPPRPPTESIFAHGMWQDILWVGLLMGGVCVSLQAWAYHTGTAHWQTMVFTVLTLSQMGNVLALRSERRSFFRQGPWSNRPLLGAVALTFLLQMATIYVPVLNPIFKTEPLTAAELALCLVLSSVVFLAVEAEKWLLRRGWWQWSS